MRGNWRTRLGYWLERFDWLKRVVFSFEHANAMGRLYTNRVNGHVIMRKYGLADHMAMPLGWWCTMRDQHVGPCPARPRWWNLRARWAQR